MPPSSSLYKGGGGGEQGPWPGDHTGLPWGSFSEEGHWVPPNLCSSPAGPHCFLRTSGFRLPCLGPRGVREDWPQDCRQSRTQGVVRPECTQSPSLTLIGHLWPQVPRCDRWGKGSSPAGTPEVQAPHRRWDKM